jgi:fumarylpyruvate hydrolase
MGQRFPIHRIYCVGRNYAEHAREMGGDPEREPPFFFAKPADALVESGASVPLPPRTADFHHEIELVVALGSGARNISRERALDCVFGYAVGNDFTRRDLQRAARADGQPWETSKGFDRSAAVGALRPAQRGHHPASARIWLTVNGTLRQNADIAHMTWKVPEIIAELSTLFELAAGDLIFTGTPAGVGRLVPGDLVEGGIEGLPGLSNRIVAPLGERDR